MKDPKTKCRLFDAAFAYTLDLANGDIKEVRLTFEDTMSGREIIDVEYEEISSTHDDTSNNQP